MFVVLAACAPAPAPQPTTHQARPSTTNACPADLSYRGGRFLCAETTVVTGDTGQPASVDLVGAGTVVEVALEGVALWRLEGSRALEGFPDCDDPYGARVRLVDPDGATWTFGLSDPHGFDPGPADSLVVGAELGFATRWADRAFDADGLALTLSDSEGPLVVVEQAWALSPEERAGITIQDGAGGGCSVDFFEVHQGFAVSCPGAEASLRTGGSVLCETEPRAMQAFVVSSSRWTDCQIGCENDTWMAWVVEP